MVDKVLKKNQGLTFDLFNELKEDEEEPEIRYKYVKEVVREPRIHYFKVPRLGCYFCVRVEYKSCLYEDAYNEAVQDYLEVKQKKKDQEEEKRQFYEKQEEEKEDTIEENNKSTNVGINGENPQRQWDEIVAKPFSHRQETYVLGINTFGQDRELDEKEKGLVFDTVLFYLKKWEEKEKMNLEGDVSLRLERNEKDKRYKELFE